MTLLTLSPGPFRAVRHVCVTALTLLACFAATPAIRAETTLDLLYQSPAGNFLAGQRALSDLRTPEAARFFASAAVEEWENPLIVERSFFAYAANGQIRDAARTAEHLLELEDSNELAKLVLGVDALKQENYAGAIQQLDGLGTDNFAGITGAILRAWAFVGDGKPAEADALLNELSEAGLEDFLVLHRAMMAEVQGDNARAIGFATTAYDNEPLVARLVEAYARLLGNEGRFEEAIDVIVNFESEGLTHPLVDVVKAALAEKRAPGPFIASVQAGSAEMFHGIGIALARDGSIDLAVVFLRLALYLDPSADVVSLALGQLLDLSGQHEMANGIYEKIAEISPMKATAVVRIAQNLDTMGNREEAIRRLGNIVETRPNDIDAASVLGDLLRYDERYTEAAEAYTKVLDIAEGDRPADWRYYYVRGIAYERAQQWERAEDDFLRALELNPDQPQVLNYLGYSWVDQGMNYDQALGMIEKAVKAVPNDGYIVDSLGWAFYKLGRIDEAVTVLEQAVQLRPNDPEINDHLGDAYWKAGRRQEARFQWTVAASVDEEGNVKERVAPKLANGLIEPDQAAAQ